MSKSKIAFVDLEGVLIPELWPFLADKFLIPELRVTTREEADYPLLLRQRLELLRNNKITAKQVRSALREVKPFDKAVRFIELLRETAYVVMVTDSFSGMNNYFVDMFATDEVYTNTLIEDIEGYFSHCEYWHSGEGKQRIFSCFNTTQKTLAVGDGLNDIKMLDRADFGILFQPSETTRRVAPDLPVALELADVLQFFSCELTVH